MRLPAFALNMMKIRTRQAEEGVLLILNEKLLPTLGEKLFVLLFVRLHLRGATGAGHRNEEQRRKVSAMSKHDECKVLDERISFSSPQNGHKILEPNNNKFNMFKTCSL